MHKTLLTGDIATTYSIIKIDESPYTTKLIHLGLVPGSTVTIIRKAPFGQVFYIKTEGNNVALRRDEMAFIHIA